MSFAPAVEIEPVVTRNTLPALLRDTPPDLMALSQQKEFYLVIKHANGTLVPIPGEEFCRGAEAAIRARALRAELGVKVEPRQRSPKLRQQRQRKGPVTHPKPKIVHEIDLDAVPAGLDLGDEFQRMCWRLFQILSHRRPMGGYGEAMLIKRFLDPIPGMQIDGIGNRYVCIGSPEPKILWSCHTDSVHHEDGLQPITVQGNDFVLAKDSGSSCLGADCGAGIFLMLEMIEAGVPGLYLFHYGEESGCIGSRWLTKNTPELVAGIDYAVAFDRKGYTDVITHQMGARCCSDAFARSLAEQLPIGYRPDDGGVYTDTAQYTGLIPECTNISVGYDGAHTSYESQDVHHLVALRNELVAFDETRLIAPVRKTTDVESRWDDWRGGHSNNRGQYGGYYGSWHDYLDGVNDGISGSRGRISKDALMGEYEEEDQDWRDKLHGFSDPPTKNGRYKYKPRTLAALFEAYPDEAADILEQWGIDVGTLWDDIEAQYGNI